MHYAKQGADQAAGEAGLLGEEADTAAAGPACSSDQAASDVPAADVSAEGPSGPLHHPADPARDDARQASDAQPDAGLAASEEASRLGAEVPAPGASKHAGIQAATSSSSLAALDRAEADTARAIAVALLASEPAQVAEDQARSRQHAGSHAPAHSSLDALPLPALAQSRQLAVPQTGPELPTDGMLTQQLPVPQLLPAQQRLSGRSTSVLGQPASSCLAEAGCSPQALVWQELAAADCNSEPGPPPQSAERARPAVQTAQDLVCQQGLPELPEGVATQSSSLQRAAAGVSRAALTQQSTAVQPAVPLEQALCSPTDAQLRAWSCSEPSVCGVQTIAQHAAHLQQAAALSAALRSREAVGTPAQPASAIVHGQAAAMSFDQSQASGGPFPAASLLSWHHGILPDKLHGLIAAWQG